MSTTITGTEPDFVTLPMREMVRDRPNWVRIQFLWVNWPQSLARNATMDGVILSLNAAISRTKGEVKRRSPSQHSYDYIPSNRAICTYLNCIARPIIPTDRVLQWSMPMEIDNTTNETHLQRRISLRMKHSNRHERLHEQSALTEKTPWLYDWSTLTMRSFPSRSERIVAIYCTAWSAFTWETYIIPQTEYDYHNDYNDRSEHTYYGLAKSTNHINEFRLQLH
jgi:hypothetical protein